jgi:hypothetical protein
MPKEASSERAPSLEERASFWTAVAMSHRFRIAEAALVGSKSSG